jgi:hypothetical protein
MRLRSAVQLDVFLDRLLAWRKKELTTLKFTVLASRDDAQHTLLRAAITLLYAHWEGFIKDAATAYVQFVAMQNSPLDKLRSNFVALALRGQIRAAAQTQKVSIYSTLVDALAIRMPQPARIAWLKAIDTESNVTSEVFKEIVHTVGVEFAPYALKTKSVIDRLVFLRNEIAHGRGLPVDVAEYNGLYADLLAMLDTFRGQLSDAAASSRHLRA